MKSMLFSCKILRVRAPDSGLVAAKATPQPGERFLPLPSAPSPLGQLINPDANIFEYCAISWNDDQSQNNFSTQDEELMIDLCGIIHSAGNSYTHYVLDYIFLWVMI